jgi:hypothetical protein
LGSKHTFLGQSEFYVGGKFLGGIPREEYYVVRKFFGEELSKGK